MRFILMTVVCLGVFPLSACKSGARDGAVPPTVGAGDDMMAAPGLKQRRLDQCAETETACQ